MTTDYNDVAYIAHSKYRMGTFEQLEEGPATPSRIAKDADEDITQAHVSRALQELRERGIVELLVDEDVRKGRVYGLTDDPEALREKMGEIRT